MTSSQDKLKELTRSSLFVAIATTIFIIEARLPLLIPLPGAKLGLSNCVTIYVAYSMGVSQAWKVLFCRILLGGFFAGQLLTLAYSATGGLCCLLLLTLLKPFCPWDKIWFVSPCCAVVHNLGQLSLATVILGSQEVFYLFPYLTLLAVISGLFVGIATQNLLAREKKIGKNP
ncbi:MAG: Gx transporter family protein [Eubacteriales bacterium]